MKRLASLLAAAVILSAAAETTLALVCSSACQDYGRSDPVLIHGWGEVLPEFLSKEVKVLNFAISGRSTKSFILHGDWNRVVAAKPDYVILALGANDTPPSKKYATTIPEFKANLRKMASEAQTVGSRPIFCTLNQAMNSFDGGTRLGFFSEGPLRKDRVGHSQAIREVAAELKLPCLELFDNQFRYMSQMGEERCATLYRRMDNDRSKLDPSHTNLSGARFVAMIIAEELAKADTPLARYVNRAKVEDVKKFYLP